MPCSCKGLIVLGRIDLSVTIGIISYCRQHIIVEEQTQDLIDVVWPDFDRVPVVVDEDRYVLRGRRWE